MKPLQQYPDHALVAMLMAARGELPGTRPSFDTEDYRRRNRRTRVPVRRRLAAPELQ
jgi:hypothetical protein